MKYEELRCQVCGAEQSKNGTEIHISANIAKYFVARDVS